LNCPKLINFPQLPNMHQAFLIQQLPMGLKQGLSIEPDVGIQEKGLLKNGKVSHNPVPPPDFVFFVNNAARQQDQYPLDWTVTNIACDRNKPDLETLYREVRSWMDLPANRQEILVLYIDNKNVLPLFIEDFANITLTVFGDVLFTPEQKREEYPNAPPLQNWFQKIEGSYSR